MKRSFTVLFAFAVTVCGAQASLGAEQVPWPADCAGGNCGITYLADGTVFTLNRSFAFKKGADGVARAAVLGDCERFRKTGEARLACCEFVQGAAAGSVELAKGLELVVRTPDDAAGSYITPQVFFAPNAARVDSLDCVLPGTLSLFLPVMGRAGVAIDPKF